jgi:para-nitrobenzyl esterase
MQLSSREWLSLQLQYAGKAADAPAARALQQSMSASDIRSFMYSRSAAQVLQGLSGNAGMYRAPQNFRDGLVLPKDTLYAVFRDPGRYNSVPLITGTNRDEMKLFMAQNPRYVDLKFGFLPSIKDPQRYDIVAAYLSDIWKALAVDGAASVISRNGGQPVYAYRWDWDEGGKNWFIDYSTLLGAGHGLEVAYIFNNFEDGIAVPGLYNSDNISGRDLLGAQMRSYWSEFAETGNPGRGRSGTLPLWRPWSDEGPNLMLLDTAAGGGLRMVREPMTIAILKQRLAEDSGFADLRERCALYVELFLLANDGADVWNKNDYNAIGCGKFEPWSLAAQR